MTNIRQLFDFENQTYVFETVMRVRSTEIYIGQHLSVEAMTAMISEVRARFLYAQGIKEINANYRGILVTDIVTEFLSRVKAREELLFEVGTNNVGENCADIFVKATRMHDSSKVAYAKMGIVYYDYRLNKVVEMDEELRQALSPANDIFPLE